MQRNIHLALDGLDLDQSIGLVSKIGQRVKSVKIHSLYDSMGRGAIRELYAAGAQRVWLDLKLKDIPNTVKLRAQALAEAGADIITVHASGGIDMMMAAVGGVAGFACEIFAVTVLTSLSEEEAELSYGQSPRTKALQFARNAKLAEVPGIVCSPQEVGMLAKCRELHGLKFVTPGVRSVGKAIGDQQRVDTPFNAFKNGATDIVVGRQITEAKDPVVAFDELETELSDF